MYDIIFFLTFSAIYSYIKSDSSEYIRNELDLTFNEPLAYSGMRNAFQNGNMVTLLYLKCYTLSATTITKIAVAR